MKAMRFAPLALFFIMVLFLSGCGRPVSGTEFVLDTVAAITLYEGGSPALLDEAFALCRENEKIFSKTVAGSDVDRVNRAGAGEAVMVSEKCAALISRGLLWGEKSGGMFDITIGSVSGLWNFKTAGAAPPEESGIKQALSQVGFETVSAKDGAVTKQNAGTKLDLGGIAKGYIADEVAAFLKENGVTSAQVNLGGNLVLIGDKAGAPFEIGVQKPFAPEGELLGTLRVADASVVTSGIYQRCFYHQGTLYHHILNPHTGYPVQNDLAAVTVVCQSSESADALSTAALALGLSQGRQLVEQTAGAEAVFVTREGEVALTPGLLESFQKD